MNIKDFVKAVNATKVAQPKQRIPFAKPTASFRNRKAYNRKAGW